MPMIFVLLFSMLLAISACGGDSGDSTTTPLDSENELSSSSSSKERGKSSSSYEVTSATTVIDSDAKDINNDKPSNGTELDSVTGKTFKTRTLGIYTWTNENLSEKDVSVKSTCYAYKDANCSLYGRLYMAKNADDLCPAGFSIPSIADWKYLMEENPSSLTYAGICFKLDTLECSGLNDSAQYLAYNGYAVAMNRHGDFSQISRLDNGFYSLRCVKYRSIVEKMEDLPECDDNHNCNYPSMFVVEKDSSYQCSWGEWDSDYAKQKACQSNEEGEKYLVNGLTYICKSGFWGLTTAEDAGVKCTRKHIGEEYIVNNIRYACTESGIIRLDYPASILGLCSSKREGSIAEADSGEYFICEGSDWRWAVNSDFLGVCDTSRYGEIATAFGTQHYTCVKGYGWRKTTELEEMVGGCTLKMNDSVVESPIDGAHYVCKNSEWKSAKLEEVFGECTESNVHDTINEGTFTYMCLADAWDPIDNLDRTLGFCTDLNVGKKGENKGAIYYCKYYNGEYKWMTASTAEEKWGYCPTDTTFITEMDGDYYKCDHGTWKSSSQSDVFPYCRSTTGEKKVYQGIEYVCDTSAYQYNGEWYAMTSLDSALGGYCRTSILNKGVLLNGQVYVCKVDSALSYKKSWRLGTMQDYMRGCTEKRFGERVFNGLDTSVCVYNTCSNNTTRTYYYDGKSTKTCIEYTSGYMWQPIVRDSLKDKRDGKVYGVLTIGSQKWLNHDLQYWVYTAYGSDGYTYSIDPTELKADAGIYKSYYYTWADAMGKKDICPDGTHIPSLAEWKTLFEYAQKLSPTDGLLALFRRWDNRTNYIGTDLYGLGLRKNGYVDMDFLPPGNNPRTHLNNDYMATYYWVSDVGETDETARALYVDTTMTPNYQNGALKEDAYTIRCIVD